MVNLSSAGHGFGDIRWHDPSFEGEPYEKFEAYGQSRTANIVFIVEFDRRHRADGVRANAVHPDMIMAELGRHMSPEDRVEQGAATSILAAVAPELEGVGGPPPGALGGSRGRAVRIVTVSALAAPPG